MKLNYKRTILVGFAFFLIMAFWQAYDAIVPLMLVNKFGLNQFWSGVIMALDNLLALFMLPLFGALSDKTKPNKYGKRKIYIMVGTICAVVCFLGLTFADNTQLLNITGFNDTKYEEQIEYWDNNYELTNNEYSAYSNSSVSSTYELQDYAAKILYGKEYSELTSDEQEATSDWFKYLTIDNSYYTYDNATDSYTLVFDNDSTDVDETDGATNAYTTIFTTARSAYAAEVTSGQAWVLVAFILLLLCTLVSMATFRSPAVALMPDVTVKPLRSKGNAVINLMGTAGGMLVLVLGILFGTGSVDNQIMSYTGYVGAVCAVMLLALFIFMSKVKETDWNEEMLATQAELDRAEQPEGDTTTTPAAEEKQSSNDEVVAPIVEEKLSPAKMRSLILILASVALWFIGYNAIISKFSLYAVNVINQDFNTTLLIAQGAAILSYIPVGMLASKIGRKKSILIGIALLTASFTGAIFVTSNSSVFMMYGLFALAGIAWATINVNSFPMVVELSQGGSIGKYTGYYYTASMAAQIVTPILSGAIMDAMGNMSMLFPYGAFFVALSFVTMLFVKHGDNKPTTSGSKLEMLDVD